VPLGPLCYAYAGIHLAAGLKDPNLISNVIARQA
jgi:hypothetical protein